MIRTANLITGLVTLCLLGGLFLLATRSGDVFHGWTATYKARFPTLQGVNPGAPVWALGMKRGMVTKVFLDGDKAAVVFRLDPEIPVREGAILSLVNKTLLGGNRLELDPGPASGTPLPDGAMLTETRQSMSPARMGELSGPIFALGEVGFKGGELIGTLLRTQPYWPTLGRIAHTLPETAARLERLSLAVPRMMALGGRLAALNERFEAARIPEELSPRWERIGQQLERTASFLNETQDMPAKLEHLGERLSLLEQKLALTEARRERLLRNTERILSFLVLFDERMIRKLLQEEGIRPYEPAFRESTLPPDPAMHHDEETP